MSRSSRRLATLVAAVAVLGAACTNQDVDGSDAASVLDDAGAPEEVQTCVGDRFDDELTQGQLNDVGGADNLADLDTDLEATVNEILDECVAGESAEDEGEGEPTDGTEGEGDSTDTTEGGESTTTSAPG